MKTLLTLLSIAALSDPAFAQAKKEKKPMAKPAAEKPAEEVKPDKKAREAKTADDKAPRAMPMNARADSIDVATKTFTMKRKDGGEGKHVVSETTEIKQGEAAAKFEDIKVGDVGSGLRNKKSDTEYAIVKITKFGAPTKRVPKPGKTAEEKKP